jgi:putative DNA primase/helicase
MPGQHRKTSLLTDEARAILRRNLVPEILPDLLCFMQNDHGNAQRLIAMFGPDIRYCPQMRKWLTWDGQRWKPDTNGESVRLAKKAMIELVRQALEAGDKAVRSFALKSLNERPLAYLLTLAQSESYVEPHQLDSDPMLLNCLNGTVELSTGELRPHRRQDYLTKLVHVEYHPDAACPVWERFIEEVVDKNLHDYLRKALGYSLTGSVIAKALFVLHGPSNSGKTTLLTTFRELISEYSTVILADTLMHRTHDNNNTSADLCDLRGARFAHTSECESSQRLSQSRLKGLVQGMGSVKACRKFENPITFPANFKLWLDTNERPGIRNVDDQATFNRLHCIPFLNAIPPGRIDPDLGQKLKAESEGILAWAIAGAKLWHETGLEKPPEVVAATEEWRAENDNIGRFIDERCVVGDSVRARAGEIYAAYKEWTEKSGERILASAREFSGRLISRGFRKQHTQRGEVYYGLGMRDERL